MSLVCVTCGCLGETTFFGPVGFGVCRDDFNPNQDDEGQHVMADDMHAELDLEDGERVAGSYLTTGETWAARGVLRVRPLPVSDDVEMMTIRIEHSDEWTTIRNFDETAPDA